MSQKKIMREFWKTIGLLSTILMTGVLALLFMAVHKVEARPGRLAAASTLTVNEVTNLTTISNYTTEITELSTTYYTEITEVTEYVTVEETNITMKGKSNVLNQYTVLFDMNDVNLLFTEGSEGNRTAIISSNTVDFEQLIVDANFTVNDEFTATGVSKFGAAALFTYDPNVGDTGSTETIDWSTGNKQMVIMSADCTFTFTAPDVGATGSAGLQLIVVQDGTGTRAITWPGTVEWPADTEPTETTTAGDGDVFSFFYIKTAGFEKYIGAVVQAYNLDD